MERITLEYVHQEAYSSSVFQRGMDYYRARRIRNLAERHGTYYATAKGNNGEEYSVWFASDSMDDGESA